MHQEGAARAGLNGSKICLWDFFKIYILFQGFTRGLMRGTLLTYSRDIPSFSTYFLTYEFFRANLFARPTQESTSGKARLELS